MNLEPAFIDLEPTYRKSDQNVWVLNMEDIPLPWDEIRDRQLVHLGPLAYGGNHSHPRREWFVAIGELIFVWLDEQGKQQREPMNPADQLRLTVVPAHLPHAVINDSSETIGMLYEFADAKMRDVKQEDVL